MNKPQLKVRNYELSKRQKLHLVKALDRIQQSAPQGAKIRGVFDPVANSFEGSLRVNSKAGLFFAKARERDLASLMAKLQSKLTRQFVRWKESRLSKRDRRIGQLSKARVAV